MYARVRSNRNQLYIYLEQYVAALMPSCSVCLQILRNFIPRRDNIFAAIPNPRCYANFPDCAELFCVYNIVVYIHIQLYIPSYTTRRPFCRCFSQCYTHTHIYVCLSVLCDWPRFTTNECHPHIMRAPHATWFYSNHAVVCAPMIIILHMHLIRIKDASCTNINLLSSYVHPSIYIYIIVYLWAGNISFLSKFDKKIASFIRACVQIIITCARSHIEHGRKKKYINVYT